ncbi:hypothetical protein DTO271D3_3689 [Paecilomyces variotii]|nr:hypothetical protein DTO169C6_2615 [Paecilomyces variotii]KAJ9288105.1 hypothetical protein DTO021C3_4278 [Paecilomyces variotii]KAJ9316113.1 hypothetical protein DTO271D3_3689 [Paecilomyces variotii]KAJ9329031.1 hypothetical protein DTO027B3_431 [Paecilomyces variotii]KAJ9335848.1 hypothetical protein DTO027B5_2441 [Paecilomyces variotii]
MSLITPLGLPPTAVFLGTTFLGLSTIPLFNPRKAYDLFGLPLYYPPVTKTSSPSGVGVESAPSTFLYVTAARDVMVGVAHFILGFQHNREGIKALMFATSVAAELDAYIVWAYGGLDYGGWHGRWILHALSGLIHAIVAYNEWGL